MESIQQLYSELDAHIKGLINLSKRKCYESTRLNKDIKEGSMAYADCLSQEVAQINKKQKLAKFRVMYFDMFLRKQKQIPTQFILDMETFRQMWLSNDTNELLELPS